MDEDNVNDSTTELMFIDFSNMPPFHRDCRAVRVTETGKLDFYGCWCKQYFNQQPQQTEKGKS